MNATQKVMGMEKEGVLATLGVAVLGYKDGLVSALDEALDVLKAI